MKASALVPSRAQRNSPALPSPGNGVLQRRCACGQHTQGEECEECRKQRRAVQHRAAPEAPPLAPRDEAAPIRGADFSRTPVSGRSLEPALAARFRPSLGGLIDRVRIHDDERGAHFARSQSAVAVTSGVDLFFARGAYRPLTDAGRDLLAHELAHVHQQHRSDGPPAGYRSRPGDRFEREADRFARTSVASPDLAADSIAAPGVRQRRTEAEQVAAILYDAMKGAGTDEQAIFNALSGRTAAELADIQTAFAALTNGESLNQWLRDDLSGDELSRALSLLHGVTHATETARHLWDAMRGLGTDEEAIYGAVAGRTADQWTEIQDAYRTLTGDSLTAELRDELTDSEWKHLRTLLPGAEGGAATAEDRATVIANRIEAAVAGPGTDEEAIYSALTGRTDAELRDIETRFRLLTGEELDVRLRDELTDSELERVRQLLHPVSDAERIARRLRAAVQGLGTEEREIYAILTGRSNAELNDIRNAYRNLYDEELIDRLREETSGVELGLALRLESEGVYGPAAQDCSESDLRAHIWPADGRAEEMTNKAIRVLGASPIDPAVPPLLMRYFMTNTPDIATILSVYETIKSTFVSGGYQYECEDDCPADNLGYVRGVWSDIHLCMNTLGSFASDCIARTIVHEFSHYYSDTDDHAYCKSGCGYSSCPNSLSTSDALDNADSFACFAYELWPMAV